MESILNEILADNVISNHELSAYSDKYSCLHCRRLQGRTARGDSNSILNSEDAVLRKSKVDLEGSFDSGISELGRRIKIARNFYAEYSITSQRIYILENDLYRGGKVEEIFPGSDMFHGKGFLHSFKYISRYREAYQKALASAASIEWRMS